VKSFFTGSTNTCRSHTAKLFKDRVCLDVRKHSFSERAVNSWNELQQHVDCRTVKNCKNGWSLSLC